jgi:hypothetical protein
MRKDTSATTMTSFAVCIRPNAPVILGRRLNLCALLAHRLLDHLRDLGIEEDEALRRAHAEIPLAEAHGVYCGSSAMIARCPTSTHTVIGSLDRHLLAVPDVHTMVQPNEQKRSGMREFDLVSKRFQNEMTRYQQHHVDPDTGIWFTGHGDRTKVEMLLADLKLIGTKRRPVRAVEFYEAEPSPLSGIVSHDGTVLRPVPCSSRLQPKHYRIAEERWRPPYWKGPQTRCYIPPVATWDNGGQIEHLIGVVG